jgi:hypothetical protein
MGFSFFLPALRFGFFPERKDVARPPKEVTRSPPRELGGEIEPNWAELDLEHFGLDLSPRWLESSTRTLPGSDLAGRAAQSSV